MRNLHGSSQRACFYTDDVEVLYRSVIADIMEATLFFSLYIERLCKHEIRMRHK